MDHDHSAMNHPDVEAVSPALFRQSCQANCVAVERLAVSWKVVLQVTPVQSGIVALDTAANFLPPDLPWSRRLDGTPPELFSPYAAYFSILRI